MNSKRGSSAVFLSVILATLMTITLALIYGVREETIRSRTDSIVNLAGDSILSEFDSYVQEEYGLFLIRGNDQELSGKLRKYILYTTGSMEDMDVQKVSASAGRFLLADTDLAREQILEHARFAQTQKLLSKAPSAGSAGDEKKTSERTLRDGAAIVSLPSADIPKRNLRELAESIADKKDGIDDVFQAGSEGWLMNQYILHYFNNKNAVADGEHFFQNEVEYILGGELSDRKNEKRVEIALKAMRFPLNLAHIYADPEKRNALLVMSEAITPGAAAAATQLALAATWAYAESDNDVELLWEGYKVPFTKDSGSWAIDLDGAIEGLSGKTVVPDVQKGYDYEQYLQMLLFFQDSGMQTARILDLIQINARYCYDGEFLISECGVGIDIDVMVNDRKYGYEKKF